MRALLLIPFLFLSLFAEAQNKKLIQYILSQGTPAPQFNIYPQDRPVLESPQTRPAAGLSLAGSIFPADLTSRNVILSGAFNSGAALNGINGSPGQPYFFTNEDSNTTIGTTSNGTAAFGSVNVTNWVELWGKDKDTPLKIRAGSGQSGIALNPQVGGSVFHVYNLSGEDIGYSTLLYSAPSSGGSFYKKVSAAWLARSGLSTEGEHIYIGHVSTSTPFESIALVHNSGLGMGREADQIKWAERTRIYNHTYKNIGQVTDASQQHALQVEVSKDTKIFDSMYDGAKRSINIFSHDILVENVLIRWTSSDGFIGKASTFWPGNPNLNGLPVKFKNCVFIRDITGSGYFAQWEETDCNLEFEDCIFSDNINPTIVNDNRGGSPTNSLIGTTTTNGNTSVPKATLLALMPTYVSEDIDNPDFMNMFPGSYWYNLGIGKGTPPKRPIELLMSKESRDTTVAYGTAFGSLDLPSHGLFLTNQGHWESLPITWDAEDYDGNTDGTYTITATTESYQNTDGIFIEKRITVEPEPPSYNVVLISLKGTGSSPYVGSGNWNHVGQSYATGNQTITGDNSSSTLASLRDTNGNLTGYGVNIVTQFEGNDTRGMNSAGAYPSNATRSTWENPGSNGTSRSFKITGLNNSIGYTFKFLVSLDTFFNGSVDITVSGSSGGGLTVDDFNGNSNTMTVQTSSPVFPSSGEVTITVLKNSGQAGLNVIEINWEE